MCAGIKQHTRNQISFFPVVKQIYYFIYGNRSVECVCMFCVVRSAPHARHAIILFWLQPACDTAWWCGFVLKCKLPSLLHGMPAYCNILFFYRAVVVSSHHLILYALHAAQPSLHMKFNSLLWFRNYYWQFDIHVKNAFYFRILTLSFANAIKFVERVFRCHRGKSILYFFKLAVSITYIRAFFISINKIQYSRERMHAILIWYEKGGKHKKCTVIRVIV